MKKIDKMCKGICAVCKHKRYCEYHRSKILNGSDPIEQAISIFAMVDIMIGEFIILVIIFS